MADEWNEETTSSNTGKPAIVWEKAGQETIGILKSVKTNVGPNGSNIYVFIDPKGEIFEVWGSVVLDDKLADKIGKEVKLVYKGKIKAPKSNRNVHTFSVFYRDVPMIEDKPAL